MEKSCQLTMILMEKYGFRYMVERNINAVMETKQAPVHSIEPQVYEGALHAKADGVELMIIGDASDYVFGGIDQSNYNIQPISIKNYPLFYQSKDLDEYIQFINDNK